MDGQRSLALSIALFVGFGAVLGGCAATSGSSSPSSSPSTFGAGPGIQIDPTWQNDGVTWTFSGRVDPQGAATDVVLEIGPGPSTLREFPSRINVAAGLVEPGPVSIATRDIPDIPDICVRFNATNSFGTSASIPLCFSHDRPSVVPDQDAPTATFEAPVFGVLTVLTGATYAVSWTEADAGSGVGSRTLQQLIAPYSAGTCGAYTNDGPASVDASPFLAAGLVDGRCYQWDLTLRDRAGNTSVITSGAVRIDLGASG
ncbi:MAG: hypothetical protein ABI573_01675 [Chloroflexota bacterium]